MNDAILPLKRYFEMAGRSRRREYWLWIVFSIVIQSLCTLFDIGLDLGGTLEATSDAESSSFLLDGGLLSAIWTIGTIAPMFTVLARRLHDIDQSAWWMAIAIVPLIGVIVLLFMACSRGTEGANRFGPDPKQQANPSPSSTRSDELPSLP